MKKQYKKLLSKLNASLNRIERALDDEERRENAIAFWEIGKEVYVFSQEQGITSKQIANDIGIPPGTMQRYVQAYRVYPKGLPVGYFGKILSFYHFSAVLPVRDKKAREFYLKEACKHDWSTQDLRRRVRNNFYENRLEDGKPNRVGKDLLIPKGQTLYTYAAKVLKVVDGDTINVEVDVGFSMRFETNIRLRGIN